QAGGAAGQAAADEEIAAGTSIRTADEVLDAMEEAGVPAGRIYTARDIAGDPHYRARDMIVEVPEPGLDDELVPMPGVVPKLSDTPGQVRRGAPLLGEHTEEVLVGVVGRGEFPRPQP